eukprot:3044836-Amphidinium_carterae.3
MNTAEVAQTASVSLLFPKKHAKKPGHPNDEHGHRFQLGAFQDPCKQLRGNAPGERAPSVAGPE